MDNRTDIWRFLQDHEVLPPPEVSARIRQDVNAASLQSHSVPPPPFLRAAIGAAIKKQQPARSGLIPRSGLIRFFEGPAKRRWVYGAVAACFIVFSFGLVIYRAAFTGKPQTPVVTNTRRSNQPAVILPADTLAAQDSSAKAPALAANDSTVGKADSSALAGTIKVYRLSSMNIGGGSIPLVDNDLLVTFTSYKYPQLSGFMNAMADRDLKVHLDQYTNIVLSKPMVILIKQIYQTRSDGSPSRKARKAKARLDDWKMADEKHFDSLNAPDPVDPIGLAEFIFK
jgi:hypothetical protein